MVALLLMETATPDLPLFARLYLDEDVHLRVANALWLRRYDAISVHEARRWALEDEEQLSFAVADGRALFTFNTSDYIRLHLDWQQRGEEHFGIIVSNQIPISEVVRRLLNLLNKVAADEMHNQLIWLQAFK
ncbi:MAG: DUF5615 family PIN-like protein [Armatimonadetes bacterium]|nr:DUF5615 family PIN-like protein [Armatimonadota bacterium]